MNQTFKPIIFSTEMVQSILAGIKTETRRIAKSENSPFKVGDILWVRETWQNLDTSEDWGINEEDEIIFKICYTYKASNDLRPSGTSAEQWCGNWVSVPENMFEAANDRIEIEEVEGSDIWYPSIHMPKQAARIFLKVTTARKERLQDIMKSPDDCVNEGIDSIEGLNGLVYKNYITGEFSCNELYSFKSLWEKINGDASWKKNPFVWVYEFEQIAKPENFLS